MEFDNDFDSFEPIWEKWSNHYYRGHLAKLEGDLVAALGEYQKAKDLVGFDNSAIARICLSETNVAMAHAHIGLDQYELAMALLDYALVLRTGLTPRCSPYVVEILEYMGLCWQAKQQYQRAQACYDEALELGVKLVGEDSAELHRLRYQRMTNELQWKKSRQ